jgi:hypothetical protein
MEQLFASGRIVDVILIFMAFEAIVLLVYQRVSGRGLGLYDIACVLIPGLFLLLALRAALLGAHWPVLAGWLLAALVAHLGDLWRRQRGSLRH